MSSSNSYSNRPIIAVLIDGYLPGHKLGGPIRSVSALVEQLGDEFDFRIVTRDRDLGDQHAYAHVEVDQWQTVGKAQVYYASPKTLRWGRLAAILAGIQYDSLYCNSLFSPRLTLQVLALRRLRSIPYSTVIVAPRGELSDGALAIKRRKKATFLAASRAMRLYEDVIWHASTEYERDDILSHFAVRGTGSGPSIRVAPILSGIDRRVRRPSDERQKQEGVLRAVFLSRIARKKNLDGALRILARVPGRVEFTIYGPIEDRAYWAECQAAMSQLPSTVTVSYKGALSHADIASALARHDLFILLTHGENFGHAILEALASGCPVLISDQTAWRGLEANGAGWDLPLSDEQKIVDVLANCVRMDGNSHAEMSQAAMDLAYAALNNADSIERNRSLFRSGLLAPRMG